MKLASIIVLGFAFTVSAQMLKADPADDAYIKQKLVEGANANTTPETEQQIRKEIITSLRHKLEDILSACSLLKDSVDDDRSNVGVARAANVLADNIEWFSSELSRLYLVIKAQKATSGNAAVPSLPEELTDLATLGDAVSVNMNEMGKALMFKPRYSQDPDINATEARMTAAVNAFKTLKAQADDQ